MREFDGGPSFEKGFSKDVEVQNQHTELMSELERQQQQQMDEMRENRSPLTESEARAINEYEARNREHEARAQLAAKQKKIEERAKATHLAVRSSNSPVAIASNTRDRRNDGRIRTFLRRLGFT